MNANSPEHAPPRGTDFPYGRLFAYYRGHLHDPHQVAAVETALQTDARWQAHWDSLRHLAAERATAAEDAAGLRQFLRELSAGNLSPFCRAVAASDGRVFERLLHGQAATAEGTRKEWERHLRGCVYCRRMQRRAYARLEREELGESLLRDWLLAGICEELLARLMAEIRALRPAVVCLLILSPKGFVAIQVGGTREELAGPPGGPSGRRLGASAWEWSAQEYPPARRRTRGLAFRGGPAVPRSEPSLPRTLELRQSLGDRRGEVTLRLHLAADGRLGCVAELARPADEPPPYPELSLEVTLAGTPLVAAGTDRVLRVEGSCPAAGPPAGGDVGVRVYQGLETWVESTFEWGVPG